MTSQSSERYEFAGGEGGDSFPWTREDCCADSEGKKIRRAQKTVVQPPGQKCTGPVGCTGPVWTCNSVCCSDRGRVFAHALRCRDVCPNRFTHLWACRLHRFNDSGKCEIAPLSLGWKKQGHGSHPRPTEGGMTDLALQKYGY